MRSTSTLILFALSAGCAGDDDKGECTGTDCTPCTGTDCTPDDTDTIETGLPPDDGLETLRTSTFEAAFGWDDAAGQTRLVEVDGNPQASFFKILFTTPDYSGLVNDPDTFCTLTYPLDGRTEPAYVDKLGWWMGFDLTFDPATLVSEDCTARLGTVFSEDSFILTPAESVQSWTVRMSFGPPGASTKGQDANQFGGEIEFDDGIDPKTPPKTPPGPGRLTGIGHVVDAYFVVQTDGTGEPVPIPAADVPSGTALVSGYYVIDSSNLSQWVP